jgi:hypothetical protein
MVGASAIYSSVQSGSCGTPMTLKKWRNLAQAKVGIDVVRVSWFSIWAREILAIRGQIDIAVSHAAHIDAAASARDHLTSVAADTHFSC